MPLTKEELEKLELLKSSAPEQLALVTEVIMQAVVAVENKTEHSQKIDRLLGESFSLEERTKLEVDNLARAFQCRRALLEDAIGTSDVLRLLEYNSRQSLHDRVQAKTLLAVKNKGVLCFPIWQFDAQGPDGVIDGLPDVLKTLQISDFAKLCWLVRPNPFLEGMKPIKALKQGRRAEVIELAKTVDYGQN